MEEKLCPKCNASHTKPGVFCSRKCANSREFSDSAKAKKSQAAQQHYDELRQSDPDALKRYTSAANAAFVENNRRRLLDDPIETLSPARRRKRIAMEQDHKCIRCGLSEWLGEPLVIEVDHIDGDNQNNQRENLRGLCPNCHSQTPTWKTGNKPHWKHRRKD